MLLIEFAGLIHNGCVHEPMILICLLKTGLQSIGLGRHFLGEGAKVNTVGV